jgi:VWA domain containing CoxE-like protein
MARMLDVHLAGDLLACHLPQDIRSNFSEATTDSALRRSHQDVIFLIDCSGSMTQSWPALVKAINPVVAGRKNTHVLKWATSGCVRTTPLLEEIENCRYEDEYAGQDPGCGTNITAAVTVLLEYLQLLRKQGSRDFLVVFVSDGEGSVDGMNEVCSAIQKSCIDNDASADDPVTLEFTSLGVGVYFPTSLAMDLRDAVDGLADIICSKPMKRLRVSSTAASFWPWEPLVESLHVGPGDVFHVPVRTQGITLTASAIQSKGSCCEEVDFGLNICPWTLSSVVSTFKQYIWHLQSESLRSSSESEEVQVRAGRTLEMLRLASEEANGGPQVVLRTVCDRVARKKQKQASLTLARLEKELQLLSEGSILTNLSDQEMAKRLAIGTMEGKYHLRALAWKGVDLKTFSIIRNEFVNLLQNPINMEAIRAVCEEEKNAGLRSACSLDSNADILNEVDLHIAIKDVASQYFLVDVLPVVGLAIRVERSNASMINPWAVRVGYISVHTPVLDTLSLLEAGSVDSLRGVQASMSAGAGETELLNSVCCLVTSAKGSAVLKPFLTSRLYQILHTYCTCGNVDTVDRAAHPALLAAVVCFMLADIENGIRRESWFETTLVTLRELYPAYGTWQGGFVSSMISDPGMTLVTESPLIQTKCQSMSKAIALALAWKDQIPESRRESIVEHICKEWIGRTIDSHCEWQDWFEMEDVSWIMCGLSGCHLEEEDLIREVRSQGPFYLIADAERAAEKVMKGLHVQVTGTRVKLRPSSVLLIENLKDGGVTSKTIRSFARLFLDDRQWDLTEDHLERYVSHRLRCGSSSYDRCGDVQPCDFGFIRRILEMGCARERMHSLSENLRRRARSEWHSDYGRSHRASTANCPKPLSFAAILALRRTLGMTDATAEELGYREDVGLCRHCCMFPNCPFYMTVQPSRGVGQHLSDVFKESHGIIPAFSVAVSRCMQLGISDVEEIYRQIEDGRHMLRCNEEMRKKIPSQLLEDREYFVEYIRLSVERYRSLRVS